MVENTSITPEAKLTPMMVQYFDLKDKARDSILFFRMGDFFEIFGDDAEEVAPKLELVLTSRERGAGQKRIPFCGVPHHSAKNYWLKLLRMGYKVALADQLEDPAEAKGIVRRGIVRVLTPGCIDDLEALDTDSPNYLMAIYEQPKSKNWTLAIADLSTGELRCGNFAGVSELARLVDRFRPREVLTRRFFSDEAKAILKEYTSHSKISFGILPEAILRDAHDQKNTLRRIFGCSSFADQPCGDVDGGVELISAVFVYIEGLHASCNQFLAIKPLQDPETMILDEVAKRDLEIFETTRRRSVEGSLYQELNHTLTPMGARILRYSLANPLLNHDRIAARQEKIKGFLEYEVTLLEVIRSELKNTPDLERLVTRVIGRRSSPSEISRIRITLEKALRVVGIMEPVAASKGGLYDKIIACLLLAGEPLGLLQRALNELPGGVGENLDVFKEGYDSEFDRLRALTRSGEEKIAEYEERLRNETKIGNLKIKNHKSFGLLIEITKSKLMLVPPSFIRRQTMVNCERFLTVELEELNENLLSAHDEALVREAQLFSGLIEKLAKHIKSYKSIAEALAQLDLLQSFASKAREDYYSRPTLSLDGRLELIASRHPVIERFVGKKDFVPNDIRIGNEARHLLITGPNMAGKSTIMRQTAICAIMHQIGCYVPARRARLPIFDRIFTRVGAADDISKGHSTFMVEMSEAAHILRRASKSSLVILDEVGRGTSTQDGLAIASAILEELALNVGCYSLFATHYHELVTFADLLTGVKAVQTEVCEQQDTVIFTHRLIDGAAGSSFGLEVAKLAGLPSRVLQRARAFMEQHSKPLAARREKLCEVHGSPMFEGEVSPSAAGGTEDDKLMIMKLREIKEQLSRVNINRVTPLQALNILNELKLLSELGRERPLFFDESH